MPIALPSKELWRQTQPIVAFKKFSKKPINLLSRLQYKIEKNIQSLRVDSSPLCGVKCRDERVHPQTT
jgi:hypothetical protein